jgi:membrane associated rhomboid family serine protease
MFVPLYDVNHLKHIKRQYVTIGLIATNVMVWLMTSFAATQHFSNVSAMALGYIPAVTHKYAQLDPALALLPDWASYVTYAFLHGNFLHIASNMLFLWVFGDNVEDAMGHVRFLIFYLLCAAAAAWFHGFLQPHSEGPLIGASGAISGVIASYFLLHPKVLVWVLILWRVPVPLPAFIPLIFWIGQQVYMLVFNGAEGVSWAAHVGGIAAGLVLTPVFKRWGVPLFDRRIIEPRAVELDNQTRVADDRR